MNTPVNFKSDFTLILHLFACDLEGGGEKTEIDFPDYDWKAIFYTTQKANAYTASCVGGECVNCVNDGGRIRVVFNDHRLSPGVLRVEFTAYLPDEGYPDGDERVVTPGPLGVTLVREAAPCPSLVEAELMLPHILAEVPVLGHVEFVTDKAVYRVPVTREAATREELPALSYGYGYQDGGDFFTIGEWGV